VLFGRIRDVLNGAKAFRRGVFAAADLRSSGQERRRAGPARARPASVSAN
jgi:hypothetical protein